MQMDWKTLTMSFDIEGTKVTLQRTQTLAKLPFVEVNVESFQGARRRPPIRVAEYHRKPQLYLIPFIRNHYRGVGGVQISL